MTHVYTGIMLLTARSVWVALITAPMIFGQTPAGESSSVSKKPDVAAAADRKVAPLSELPYSPSLDVNSMDRSADPCTNFYQYACGGWIKKNPIPPDQARWDVYSKLQYENELFLWGILDEAAKPSAKRSAAQQKIGDYFYACMDESGVEKAGAAPLKVHLDAVARLGSIHQLAELLAREHLEDTAALFGFGSNQDFEDSSRVIAFASAGGLGLPDRDYYVKDEAKMKEIRQRYIAHVSRMFELLGDDAKTAAAEAQMVRSIETGLAKASLTQVDKRDPYKLFHKLSLAQLKALTPSLGWDTYLEIAGAVGIATVNVTEPEFYKEIERQLGAHDLANWKTYLRWHLAHSKAPYLSSAFVNENFAFYGKALRGIEQLQPRWKRCVQYVDRDLGEALGQVFVQKTFGPEVKNKTLNITKHIESAMEAEIQSLSWMGDGTKQRALLKLHAVANKIGYPEKWRDYSAQMNDINFPAGVLQPPLFDFKLDDAPNYGNTGATIGH